MTFTVRGVVTSGLGKGQEFVALDGYAEQFEDVLGYEPYPGTLNLELDDSAREAVEALDAARIDGWQARSTSFGAVNCYPAAPVRDGSAVRLHLIVPDRTDHDMSTLEFVSPVQLRERFDLVDGSTFVVRIGASSDE